METINKQINNLFHEFVLFVWRINKVDVLLVRDFDKFLLTRRRFSLGDAVVGASFWTNG